MQTQRKRNRQESGGGARRCNKVHRAGRIKRSSITTWGPGESRPFYTRPRELGCGILFRALGMLSTAKNFHKTAICHLRPAIVPARLLRIPLRFHIFVLTAIPCKSGPRLSSYPYPILLVLHLEVSECILRGRCYMPVYESLETRNARSRPP